MSDARALLIGEALIDIVPGQPANQELPGGSPMNVAITLGRLGRPAELAAWIGRDARAGAIRDHLAASGVALAPGGDGAPRTSTASVRLDASGQAQYVFDFEWDFHPPARAGDFALVHTGSLATVIEPGAAKVAAFFQGLAEAPETAPTLTYDPNLRPALAPPPEVLRPAVEALVAAADVVKASDEDLRLLYPDRDPAAVGRDWAEAGPALVVLTRGGAGALAFAGPIALNAQAKNSAVVDTVGAGDTFMGGLIDGLWSLGLIGPANRPRLRAISETQLLWAMDRAAAAAAVTVSRAGADPPWASELL
ncbi:MAG: PfkB family carbohydrate kinase [Bifidobacteriaceae bacterium]|nr:PfkB family carbohydrate kinase [Bifidobacteriaceae bacterium]